MNTELFQESHCIADLKSSFDLIAQNMKFNCNPHLADPKISNDQVFFHPFRHPSG